MIVEMAHTLDSSQVCYKMKPHIMELKLDEDEESSKDMPHSAWTPKMKMGGVCVKMINLGVLGRSKSTRSDERTQS